MAFQTIRNMITIVVVWISMHSCTSVEVRKESAAVEDYCVSETFQPRCLKNEVILMQSATYGRMRIGKCITTEEVAAQRLLAGDLDDPRILGCSANVLPLLDRNCSGKAACELRVFDISVQNIQPCFPVSNVFLEVSYECITVVDERRSCSVAVSKNSIHITGSFSNQRICGTKSQPWIVEAQGGQRLSITLLDFTSALDHQSPKHTKQSCYTFGNLEDKAGKRNVTICGNGEDRERSLYLTTGNAVEIFFIEPDSKTAGNGMQIILKLEAIGCTDVIPPEDSWLKRNGESIVIGCYASRQTWQLTCEGGKWIGVIGNCSHESFLDHSIAQPNYEATFSRNKQVLAIVAICGFTMAVCLAIMCIGAICLRRFHTQKKKKKPEYKTLSYPLNSGQGISLAGEYIGSEMRNSLTQVPTYSIYGLSDSNDVGNPINPTDSNSNGRL